MNKSRIDNSPPAKAGDTKRESLLPNCPDVVTVAEAAKMLCMPVKRMREIIDSGAIEMIPTVGPPVVFRVALEKYLENQRKTCYPNSNDNQHDLDLDNVTQSEASLSEGDSLSRSKSCWLSLLLG
jgi:hypothetical protein